MIIFLFILTTLRLFLAASGHLNEGEAYLLLCGRHLDWSFVEGPAGVPALMRFGTELFGVAPLGARLFSPLLLCVASFVMASLAQSLYGKKVALWSVVAFNLLPLTNAASLVMEGTIAVACWWILAVGATWKIMTMEKKSFSSWLCLGVILAIGTQFSYPIGILLLIAVFWDFFISGKAASYGGLAAALFFLLLGWAGPLMWNLHHDWLSWSKMTWNAFWSWHVPVLEVTSLFFWSTLFLLSLLIIGITQEIFLWWRTPKKAAHKEGALLILLIIPLFFYIHELGHGKSGFAWLLLLLAFLLPSVVSLFLKKIWLKNSGIALLGFSVFGSLLLIGSSATRSTSCWTLPNLRGVTGLQPIAVEILRWRATQQDGEGKMPFVIAQSPGLAALLGSVLPITYPESPEAPPVFVPESPGLENQFQLWPHYADATAVAAVDPLYTEEKVTSPFLNRDALYVTSEKEEELPQTIHGAFAIVEPLDEVMLQDQGEAKKFFIYHCKNYQMLSL